MVAYNGDEKHILDALLHYDHMAVGFSVMTA